MRTKQIILTFILLLACTASYAGPAVNRRICLTQPDGSTFEAWIKGDEHTRIKTDDSGHAIIQDADGWWHYAVYSGDGRKISSGWKVGSAAPHEILSQSGNIPYGRLAEAAKERRMADMLENEAPILKRMQAQRGVSTKSDDTEEPLVKHGLVILANFKDVKFKHTKEEFEMLLTEEGYSVNGATGSVKEYFDDQFNGKMKFDFHVTDIVTLSKNRINYGGNDSDGTDKAPAEMIVEACKLADPIVDYSLYDDDNDGKADNVFIFFAGEDEAEGGDEECIWSHAWYVYSGAGIKLTLDGIEIDRYACTSELTIAFDRNGKKYEFISGIGTFCHEYSHTLGLPDFYDTDYEESGGIAAGFWVKTSLMDGGNYNNMGNTPPYFNAFERMIAGISEPEVLKKTGTYTLDPINVSGRSYMIESKDGNEIYLFECRSPKGWDSHIGGSGMLAYHIDLSNGGYEKWLTHNKVNADPSHQRADLMEADGRVDGFAASEEFQTARQDISGIFYPYGSVDSINDDTIVSITKSGDAIRFNYMGSGDILIPPTAVNISNDTYADAAIISFESSYPYTGEATVTWGRPGKDRDTMQVAPYETGKYAAVIEGLDPTRKTYEIDIYFVTDGMESERKTTSVITQRMPESLWPYIHFGNVERHSDGTFEPGARSVLRVYGAVGAAEIRLEFNGKPMKREGDGYYTLKESGMLQATVYWEDGSIDKVVKEIIISE